MPQKASRTREWMLRLSLMAISLLFVMSVLEIAARVVRSRQQGGKEGREDCGRFQFRGTTRLVAPARDARPPCRGELQRRF